MCSGLEMDKSRLKFNGKLKNLFWKIFPKSITTTTSATKNSDYVHLNMDQCLPFFFLAASLTHTKNITRKELMYISIARHKHQKKTEMKESPASRSHRH